MTPEQSADVEAFLKARRRKKQWENISMAIAGGIALLLLLALLALLLWIAPSGH